MVAYRWGKGNSGECVVAGFIPMVAFVTLQDKFCDYFKCDREKVLDYFLESFKRTHLDTHLPPPGTVNMSKGGDNRK